MLKRFIVLATIVLALAASSVPAYAITDGSLDGDAHPYVGLMVAFGINPRTDVYGPLWRCSGTLMSETVFLTAGHCVEAPATHAEIWFSADAQTNSNHYLSDGVTVNPDWNGYPFTGSDVGGRTVENPDWNPKAFYYRDAGVVVLDTPYPMDTYGALPRLNQLDSLRVSAKTTFTSVGYGLQKSFPDGASFLTQAYKVRMVANPHLIQINGALVGDFSLLLSNNANTGGTCFGDSGGPNFLGTSNVVAGVTSFGLNGTCGGTGGVYRMDRSWNLDWLHTFGI